VQIVLLKQQVQFDVEQTHGCGCEGGETKPQITRGSKNTNKKEEGISECPGIVVGFKLPSLSFWFDVSGLNTPLPSPVKYLQLNY
jgi:hypothetical protein